MFSPPPPPPVFDTLNARYEPSGEKKNTFLYADDVQAPMRVTCPPGLF